MCWSCCSGATHLRASSEGFVSRPPTPLSVPRRSQVQQKFCFSSTRQWFLILPVNLFQLQFCLIPERHILSSLQVSHMHEFVVFSLPSNLVFLSSGGQMISSKINLYNQSKLQLFVQGFPLSSSQFRLWCHSGMVWLKANKAIIVCSDHSVSVPRRSQVQQKFCFSSTRQMVPHPSCQPFFSYSSVWYRSVTFFHLSKFRTCMSLLCFPCRLISCFSLPVDKGYLRRSVLTINQSLNFLFEAFLFLFLSSGFDVTPAWFGWRPTKL